MTTIFAKDEDKVALLDQQAAKAAVDSAKYSEAGDIAKAETADKIAREARVAAAQMRAQIANSNK